jgi:hypothetical protein
MSVAQSTIELDQDDLTERLESDEVFAQTVKVFSQRKGITENDVMTALGAVNSINGKAGLVVIVLMPQLIPDAPDAPGPRYYVRYPIQVIDWPTYRRVQGGNQISAETIAQRVRQVVHGTQFGRGQSLYFDGLETAPMAEQTQVSYIIFFRRLGNDPQLARPANVVFSPKSGTAPLTVTLTCATVGVDIWYTTDGSYPGPENENSTLYMGPVAIASGLTMRASAVITGSQQGDVTQATYLQGAPVAGGSPLSTLGGSPLGSTELGG